MVINKRRPLREAVEKLGGYTATARVVGGSWNKVWKWVNLGHMPHTEFSGATDFATKISVALDNEITAESILEFERGIIAGKLTDPDTKDKKQALVS